MRERFLVAGFFGIIAGVAFGSFFDFGFALPALFALLGSALFVLAIFYGRSREIFTISILITSAALGLARTELESYRYEIDLSGMEGERVVIKGMVADYPDVRETKVRLIIKLSEITAGGKVASSRERILVTTELYPSVRYGDSVVISGTLHPIKNFSADESAVTHFDYKKFMGKDGIFHEVAYPKLNVVSSGSGNPVVQKLFAVRELFSESVRQNIREPESSLALGELLGEKHTMPKDLLDTFKKAGIIHLVVLSGYNISLVSQFFMRLFSFFPLLWRVGAGTVSIILFVVMTGGGASAIRAAVMAGIVLLGTATGRSYDAGRALFAAGLVMIIFDPNILIFDPSFQLSFLATLGLIYMTPIISRYFSGIRLVWVRELLSQTLSTQIAVLPLIIYLSGQVSVMALPVNLLVLPSVPLAMLGAFMTGLAGFIGTVIATPFAFVSSAVLFYAILMAKFFAGLPFSVVPVRLSLLLTFFSYALLLVAYLEIKHYVAAKKQI